MKMIPAEQCECDDKNTSTLSIYGYPNVCFKRLLGVCVSIRLSQIICIFFGYTEMCAVIYM